MDIGRGAARRVPARLVELDGLRGWAALWVVVFHLGWETFGVIHPVFRNPLAAAFNGSLAVTVFFVLSGEALSSGFFAGRGLGQVAGLAVKRLPRLGIPIFFALALTFLLARAGLTDHVAETAVLTQRPDWLGQMHPDAIPPSALIRFPLIEVFVANHSRGDRMPFLWTMNAEMLGSLLVFVLLLCWDRLRGMEWLAVTLGLILLTDYGAANLAGFCFGVVISHWRHRGALETLGRAGGVRWLAAAAIPLLLAGSAAATLQGPGAIDQHRIMAMIAPLLVLAVSLCPPARRVLSNRPSRLLGQLSFPLYLVQYPVLVSLTAALIVQRGAGVTAAEAAGIVLLSTLACLAVAVAFLPVERLTRLVTDAIGRVLVKGPERQVAPV